MESFGEFYKRRKQSFMSIAGVEMLMEGLIKSIPILKMAEMLKKHDRFVAIRPVEEGDLSIDVEFDIGNGKEQEFIDDLNEKLIVTGYHVAKSMRDIFNYDICNVMIEMIHPPKLTPEEIQKAPWYHITNSQFVDKILKNGLGPRQSQTTFKHPGNRIYIVQTNDIDSFVSGIFKYALKSSKIRNLQTQGAKQRRIDNWESSSMVTLQLDIDPDFDVMDDPMFPNTGGHDYRACFTYNYISPDRIEIFEL